MDDFPITLERIRNNDPKLTSLLLVHTKIGSEEFKALARA